LGSRKHRLGYAPELTFIAAAVIDVGWTTLAGLGLTAWPPVLTFGIPTYVVFALAMAMVLVRVIELSRRVAKLERLLSTDEEEIAALSVLPDGYVPLSASLSPPCGREGPIEAGVRDAIAGYQLADYSLEEAKGLAREVLRLEVKRAGGWAP
jgi:hypothetical protein